MKLVALTVLGVTAASAAKLKVNVTPVQKVLQMLKGMLANGQTEKQEEQVAFAAYKQWCDSTATDKAREIRENTALIEQLTADIQKYESDVNQLGLKITAHDADVAGWNMDLKDAIEIRSAENKDFVTTHKDYSESIDALERAITMLKKQNYSRSQAASLLQAVSGKALIPESARRVITAFLEQTQDPVGVAYKAPEAHAYEFQSTGVIEMLEKLLDKFEDERTTLEKEESNGRHAFELLEQDLRNQIATATEQRNSKAEERANKQQAAANAKSDLTDTTATRDADQKFLDELTNQCSTKNSEFESRQKLRTDEISSLEQAIEILAGVVQPNAEKHLPSFLQKTSKLALSLLQLGSSKQAQQKDVQQKVSFFLTEAAKRIGSRALSAIAVKASEDPFVKVKQMIQDLIVRLMEEANQEAEHKGWCDTELKANDLTRKQKTSEVDSLSAEIDKLTADIAKLGQEINDLTKAINELDSSVAKATENRQTENKINTATIKDSQESQQAVAQALTILKDFYAKAGTATSLVQVRSLRQSPITWDKPYQGQQGQSGGVVGMLEVIQSDFARLETETKADEAQAAKDYSQFMNEAAVNKASMSKDVEYKTDKKATLSGKKEERTQDRDGAQKELDAALVYYDKLKPACIDSGNTFEDRVGRRKEEIESLQEALRILNGEDMATGTAFMQADRSRSRVAFRRQ